MKGSQIRQWRLGSRLSQEQAAELLNVSQPTLSRMESADVDVPASIAATLMGKMKDLVEVVSTEPTRIKENGIAAAEKKAKLAAGVQEATGIVGATILNFILPKTSRLALIQHLDPGPDYVLATSAQRDESRRALAEQYGKAGENLLSAFFRTRQALLEKRWDDAVVFAELALGQSLPGLESLARNIEYNRAVAEVGMKRFDSARQRLLALLENSTDDFERGMILNELGMIEFEENIRYSINLDAETHQSVDRSINLLTEAARFLREETLCGCGILTVANRVEDLGERKLALEIAKKGSQILAAASPAKLEQLKGKKKIRKKWRRLSQIRGFVDQFLPFLLTIMLAISSFGKLPKDDHGVMRLGLDHGVMEKIR